LHGSCVPVADPTAWRRDAPQTRGH
jgi:hypothetical protein